MTCPAGQFAADGDAAVAPWPASGAAQVQVPPTPFCQASASPPDVVAAKNSVCPEPLPVTAGTPARLAGLPVSTFHDPQDVPFQEIMAAEPAAVRQNTSTSL